MARLWPSVLLLGGGPAIDSIARSQGFTKVLGPYAYRVPTGWRLRYANVYEGFDRVLIGPSGKVWARINSRTGQTRLCPSYMVVVRRRRTLWKRSPRVWTEVISDERLGKVTFRSLEFEPGADNAGETEAKRRANAYITARHRAKR